MQVRIKKLMGCLLLILCGIGVAKLSVMAAQPQGMVVLTPDLAGGKIQAQSVRGEQYLFLPSYINLNKFTLELQSNGKELSSFLLVKEAEPEKQLVVGENAIDFAAWYGDLADEIAYKVIVQTSENGIVEKLPLNIMKSANISTVYVKSNSPQTKGIQYVEAVKGNKAETEITVVNPYGGVVYQAGGQIRGRGNSTWTAAKKPYQIKLAKKATLLQGQLPNESAKTWILLANAFDQTKIHNTYGFALGKQLGLITPDGEAVDLYYDGNYRGSYYLCEKVERGQGRLAIGKGTLIELDCAYFKEEKHWFQNSSGAYFTIKEPNKIDAARLNKIKGSFEEIREAVLNGGIHPVSGKSTWDYLDLDSFASYYVHQMLTANADGYFSSTYYYIPENEEKIYSGPVWDLDDSFGIRADMADYRVEGFPMGQLWIDSFLQDEVFQKRVHEIYQAVCPTINSSLISREAEKIRASVAMDEMLWPQAGKYATFSSYEEAISAMEQFSTQRNQFLYNKRK